MLMLLMVPSVQNESWQKTVYTVSFDAGVIQNTGATDSNAAFSIQFTTG